MKQMFSAVYTDFQKTASLAEYICVCVDIGREREMVILFFFFS